MTGLPAALPQPPHHTQLTTDVFRHVAVAYGDDNPLWCDPAYGPGTRWEGPIAPPPLVELPGQALEWRLVDVGGGQLLWDQNSLSAPAALTTSAGGTTAMVGDDS